MLTNQDNIGYSGLKSLGRNTSNRNHNLNRSMQHPLPPKLNTTGTRSLNTSVMASIDADENNKNKNKEIL